MENFSNEHPSPRFSTTEGIFYVRPLEKISFPASDVSSLMKNNGHRDLASADVIGKDMGVDDILTGIDIINYIASPKRRN